MAALDHPFQAEIGLLREILLGADPAIAEGIKWNAPSFRTTEYFATTHLRGKGTVGLILHLGAKARELPPGGLKIADPAGLLKWLGKDRALLEFHSRAEIEAARTALTLVRGSGMRIADERPRRGNLAPRPGTEAPETPPRGDRKSETRPIALTPPPLILTPRRAQTIRRARRSDVRPSPDRAPLLSTRPHLPHPLPLFTPRHPAIPSLTLLPHLPHCGTARLRRTSRPRPPGDPKRITLHFVQAASWIPALE